MDIVLLTNKGFTILDLLISLFIISLLTLLSLNHHSTLYLEHYYFLNEYLLIQSEVIMHKHADSYKNGITFNNMGHVNLARTIMFDNHEVIIHLGNGYATYR